MTGPITKNDQYCFVNAELPEQNPQNNCSEKFTMLTVTENGCKIAEGICKAHWKKIYSKIYKQEKKEANSPINITSTGSGSTINITSTGSGSTIPNSSGKPSTIDRISNMTKEHLINLVKEKPSNKKTKGKGIVALGFPEFKDCPFKGHRRGVACLNPTYPIIFEKKVEDETVTEKLKVCQPCYSKIDYIKRKKNLPSAQNDPPNVRICKITGINREGMLHEFNEIRPYPERGTGKRRRTEGSETETGNSLSKNPEGSSDNDVFVKALEDWYENNK